MSLCTLLAVSASLGTIVAWPSGGLQTSFAYMSSIGRVCDEMGQGTRRSGSLMFMENMSLTRPRMIQKNRSGRIY